MATTAHAIRLTIRAVAPMATVATNVKHCLVSDLTNLNIASLRLSVMPCFEGIESIVDKLIFFKQGYKDVDAVCR